MSMFFGGPETSEHFERSLFDCVQELNNLVPGLSARYSQPVILSALAEQMGSGLHTVLRRKWCDALQVRGLLRSVEAFALHDPQAPGASPGPKTDSTH